MIQGEITDLHPFDKEELKNTLKWKNDPIIKEYIGTVYPISMEEHKRWFDKLSSNDNIRFFSIKTKEGDHIGNINLRINWKDRNCEFGILIAEKTQGKGYGTDALKTVVNFAFEELNMHRIWCQIFEYNKAAVRVYEKAGFAQEGIMKEALFHEGKYHDKILMSMLNNKQ